jgi:hypothetical protein
MTYTDGFGKMRLNFDPEEVARFMATQTITRVERNLSMGDLMEQDNCRRERGEL